MDPLTAIMIAAGGVAAGGVVKWGGQWLASAVADKISAQLNAPVLAKVALLDGSVHDLRQQLADQMPPEGEAWANGSTNLHQAVSWIVAELYAQRANRETVT